MTTSAAEEGLVGLLPVESLTVISIVDNETDSLSSACGCCADPSSGIRYFSEFSRVVPIKGQLDFRTTCCAAHGLSLLLVAKTLNEDGSDVEHSCLFDAGPQPDTFSDNVKKLSVDLTSIEQIVLSHYHADHSSGLRSAVPLIAEARKAAKLPPPKVDLHPDCPECRGLKFPTGKIGTIQPPDPTFEELTSLGGTVVASNKAHSICVGSFFVSGEIPRVTEYETGLPGHMTKLPGKEWAEDPLLMDERYVAVHVTGGGIVVFSACSHAGIVNVCKDAVDRGGGLPLLGVMGGFHLAGGPGVEGRVQPTVADMVKLDPKVIFPGHCTGWRAKMALTRAFPDDRVQPAVVGGKYVFSASLGKRENDQADASTKASKESDATSTMGKSLGDLQ